MALGDHEPTLIWWAESNSDLDEPTGTTVTNPNSGSNPTLAGSGDDTYAQFDGSTQNIVFTPATPVMEVGTGDFTMVIKWRPETGVAISTIAELHDGSGSYGLSFEVDGILTDLERMLWRPEDRGFVGRYASASWDINVDCVSAIVRESGTLRYYLDIDGTGGMTNVTGSMANDDFGTSAVSFCDDIAFGATQGGDERFDGRIYYVLGIEGAVSNTDLTTDQWDKTTLKAAYGSGASTGVVRSIAGHSGIAGPGGIAGPHGGIAR